MDKIVINNLELDESQTKAIINDSKSTIVIAGAGSGKTLTIQGKIKYLIEEKKIKEDEILCISFTNETVNNLYNKLLSLGYDIEVKTFHKLGLKFLDTKNITIASDDYLSYIIDEYFKSYIKYDKNKANLFKTINYTNKSIDYLLNSKEYNNLKTLINTFIKLSKCNDISLKQIYKMYKWSFFRDKVILKYILEIYRLYELELESSNKIDMDDIIIKSKEHIKEYKLKYKYIIIDEFQDTSMIRLNLIKEIVKNTNAKLFVVGDDFQSIYRFSGCDLDLFINFKNYFEDTKYFYLRNTYRNSNQLIYVSVNFIMRNPNQLRKNIISNKNNYKPIKILFNYSLEDTLNLIENKKDILVLGRNNKDIENINFANKLTIHKSKGLEADNIILINSDNIPSKIKDNQILNKLKLNKDRFPYNEERRLFYVALTRTKNNIYILVNNPSLFIKELIRDYKNFIEIKKKN